MLNGHRHFPAALPLGEKSGIHEIWGSVGPGDGSNIFGTEKSTGPIGIRLPDRRAHSPFATPTAVITAVCAKENKILKHISPSPHFTCVCAVCLLPSLLYNATYFNCLFIAVITVSCHTFDLSVYCRHYCIMPHILTVYCCHYCILPHI